MITEWIGAAGLLCRKVSALCVGDYYRRRFARAGRNVRIGHQFVAYGPEFIAIEDNVSLGHHAVLRAISVYPWTTPPQSFSPKIEIKRDAFVNSFTELSAANRIVVGEKVMIAEGCFITDNAHGYGDVSRSIREQPLQVLGEVHIGAGSLIGCRTFIQGNVTIGKHCVVGANSVVTRSLPDYCVAAGAPARILKRYDADRAQWRRTGPEGDFLNGVSP